MLLTASHRDQVIEDGFALVAGVLAASAVSGILKAVESLERSDSVRSRGGVFAIRNLLNVLPEARDLAYSTEIRQLVTPILGDGAFPVRGILFDKTPGANWKVPWHQDVTIAVQSRVETEGFGPWSTKAGVLHVQPPASVLEQMLSVRIHLDRCEEANGALRMVPGSHLLGKLPETEAARLGALGPAMVCAAENGDALLLRPLLLHASSASDSPHHRRVLHFDFSSKELPGALNWAV